VTQAGKEVNRLFKADFFGERALLANEPRGATVAAVQETTCLTLDRATFVEILGPLDETMKVGAATHRTFWPLCR
jgi:cGMP-dependent protein kinase 2